MLEVIPSTDYIFTDDTITISEFASAYTNATIPASVTISQISQTSSKSDTSYWITDISILNVSSSASYEVDVSLTCSVSGNSDVSNSFTSDKGKEVPNWISVDNANSKLIVSTPSVAQVTSYSFTLKVVTSEKPLIPVYRNVFVQISWFASNWKYWESNSSSRCNQCNSGYQVYSNQKTWELSSVDNMASAMLKTTISLLCIAVGIVILTSIINQVSPSGLWIMINGYQALMLLLLTGAYFPKTLTDYLSGLNFTLFSFNFVPVLNPSYGKEAKSWIDYDVDNDYLETIGLNSDSTLINNFNTLLIFILIISIHLAFGVLYRCLFPKLNGHPKLIKIANWVFKLLTLNIYIRIMVESNQFWLITSIYEINLAQIYSANRLVSLIIAWCFLSVWLKFLIVVILKTRSSMKQETQLFKETFSELFEGIKDNKLSKLFTAVQMIRKVLAVAFLMSLSQLNIYVKISTFLMLNFINLLYVVFSRPMMIVKENFITILNEVLLIVLTCLLYLWNTQTDWSKLQ